MPNVVAKTRLQEIVTAGGCPIGSFVTSIDPATSTILGSLGFDFLIIDCEHGPLDKTHALSHVRAAQAAGIIPLARILENSAPLIQSFLDVGVQGIIVPHVETVEDARRMVVASRYGPGGRGMCPICHAADYSLEGWAAFIRQSNENVLMIPLIESRRGVQNIKDIIAVDGIDIVKFGPGDLSQDMGLNLTQDSGKLMPIWREFRDTIHAAGKLVMAPGGYGFDGADLVCDGMDLLMLRNAASKSLNDHWANRKGDRGHYGRAFPHDDERRVGTE